MRLIIDEKVIEKYPGLTLGVLVAKRLDNAKKSTALRQIFDGITAVTKSKLSKEDFANDPKFSNWRNIFEDMGAKTYQSSLEQLIEKALKSKEIPFDDNLSRIRDYSMLKYKMPITAFNLDEIYGDIHLTLEKDKVVYRDQGGDLTKRWNSEQLERGTIKKETTNVVFIFENVSAYEEDDLRAKITEVAHMIKNYCFALEFEEDFMKPPRKEKDLGVTGLTELEGADDEKEEGSQKSVENKEESPAENTEENKSTEVKPPKTKKPEPGPFIKDEHSIKYRIEVLIKSAAEKAFPEADLTGLLIEYPRDKAMGDYACSIALKLAKQLAKEPLKIAEEIVKHVEPVQFVETVQTAPPGFINVSLSRPWVETKIKDLAQDEPLYNSSIGGSKVMVFDYSSPNIAKPLGVHHLLSTLIGQTLYNLYKSLGYRCIGVNHLGDWGTQFGKLIYAYRKWGNKKDIEKDPMKELLKLYVKFHDEVENDKGLEDKGREEFAKLEKGDKENMELWEWFRDLTIKDLEKLYNVLDVHFDEYIGEAFFNDKMEDLIKEGQEKGVITEGERGALIVDFGTEEIPPYLLRKSDGATLYSTRDLATIAYRLRRWEPAQIVYVVDYAQNLHFKQLFLTAEKMGYDKARLTHVSFGRMHLPEGKMSTRKGTGLLLEDLLKEAVEKTTDVIKEKSTELSKKERDEVIKKVAIGAVKYNILSQNRSSDITFDWTKMLSLDGNSAPYLQYTTARAQSILRKYEEMKDEAAGKAKKGVKKGKKEDEQPEEESAQTTLFDAIEKVEGYDDGLKPFEHPLEQSIAKMLMKYQEYLVMAAEEFKPNLLSNYLHELAQEYNSFYNSVSVLQADNKHVQLARLNLTKAVTRVLKDGLSILGIEVPERM